MGFCYDFGGLLCCDLCNSSGGVRKKPCPYGYCQKTAYCPACWAKENHAERLKRHAPCKIAEADYQERQQEKERLLRAGFYLRTAALTMDSGRVKVIFRDGTGAERAFFMSHSAYDAVPIGFNAVIEDYLALEQLQECASLDIYENK